MFSQIFSDFLNSDIPYHAIYGFYIACLFFLPYIFAISAWKKYKKYIRTNFLARKAHTLLQIRPPKEVTKSPLAMEIFITSLYQTQNEGTWIDRLVKGQLRPWFSLELVSIAGEVRFYIATRSELRTAVEANLYSQYPDIEIFESKDYTLGFDYDPTKFAIAGFELQKVKEDFIPIKTYPDFGLDKDPKDEHKIEPLTPTFEFLGLLQKGEQAWIQILVKAHKKEMKKPGGSMFDDKVDWTYMAKEYVKKTMKGAKVKEGESIDKLSKAERSTLDSIEENVAKVAFDTGIRVIYISDLDKENKGHSGGLKGIYRQFGSNLLNGLKPRNDLAFDYPWQDVFGWRLPLKKKEMIASYKAREFFPPLYDGKPFVMSTAELATIYHFPSLTKTPSLSRIEAKRSEPPTNLPI